MGKLLIATALLLAGGSVVQAECVNPYYERHTSASLARCVKAGLVYNVMASAGTVGNLYIVPVEEPEDLKGEDKLIEDVCLQVVADIPEGKDVYIQIIQKSSYYKSQNWTQWRGRAGGDCPLMDWSEEELVEECKKHFIPETCELDYYK